MVAFIVALMKEADVISVTSYQLSVVSKKFIYLSPTAHSLLEK